MTSCATAAVVSPLLVATIQAIASFVLHFHNVMIPEWSYLPLGGIPPICDSKGRNSLGEAAHVVCILWGYSSLFLGVFLLILLVQLFFFMLKMHDFFRDTLNSIPCSSGQSFKVLSLKLISACLVGVVLSMNLRDAADSPPSSVDEDDIGEDDSDSESVATMLVVTAFALKMLIIVSEFSVLQLQKTGSTSNIVRNQAEVKRDTEINGRRKVIFTITVIALLLQLGMDIYPIVLKEVDTPGGLQSHVQGIVNRVYFVDLWTILKIYDYAFLIFNLLRSIVEIRASSSQSAWKLLEVKVKQSRQAHRSGSTWSAGSTRNSEGQSQTTQYSTGQGPASARSNAKPANFAPASANQAQKL